MDEEIYLSDLFAPVFAKWKRVFIIMLLGAAVGAISALTSPRMYESTFTIYVQQNSGLGALKSSLPIAGLGGLGGGSSTGYYTTILKSDSLLRKTMRDLDAKYGLLKDPAFTEGEKLPFKKAFRRLQQRIAVNESKSGAVDVSVKWSNPLVACRIANGLLDSLAGSVSNTSDRKVDYIKMKLDQTTRQLDEAQNKLLEFQKKSGVPVLEEEGKRLVEVLGKLDEQLLTLDIDLQETKSNLGNQGDLDALVAQEIRKRGIESGREHVVKERDAVLAKLNSLPELASTYVRLQRDVMVQEKTFELLTERYQLSRIEQQGEGGQYDVIDRAIPADQPVPRGAAMKSALGGFTGAMVSSIWIMAASLSRKRKKGLR